MSSHNRFIADQAQATEVSDGSSANYYLLPAGAEQLQDLIAYRDMNAQIGEIFRACYRYGRVAHSSQLRDAKKILFYAHAEVERLKRKEEEEKQEALKVQEVEAVAEGRVFENDLKKAERFTPRQRMILSLVRTHFNERNRGMSFLTLENSVSCEGFQLKDLMLDVEMLLVERLIEQRSNLLYPLYGASCNF